VEAKGINADKQGAGDIRKMKQQDCNRKLSISELPRHGAVTSAP
jgi:hypothetical protein